MYYDGCSGYKGGSEMYQRYEQLKQKWIAENPNATNKELEAAIKRIARQLGI